MCKSHAVIAKVLRSAVNDAANVRLESEDIGRRMLASLPSALADLLDVATYVDEADRMIGRGGESAPQLAAGWRRELRFIVRVRKTKLWTAPEVVASLERVLGFMSEDSVRFEFVEAANRSKGSGHRDFGSDVEEVIDLRRASILDRHS